MTEWIVPKVRESDTGITTDPNLQVQVDNVNNVIDIRQSAISSFMDCRRKFFYEYVLGIEPDYPDGPRPWTTADTGTALHEGIGAYYLGNDPADAVSIWALEQWPDGDLPDKHQMELVEIMLEGHIADLAQDGADIGETTVSVELPVLATVHDVDHWDINIHGRVDRLVETEDGNVIDDWKSVASFQSIDNYLHQLGRYALLVRSATNWRADRVRTTQIKRVKRTKDGPFYQRPWTPLSEDAYATQAINLRAVLRDMVRVIDQDGPWYEHYTGECSWKCRVQDVCQAQMRGDDPETIVELHYRKKQ